MKNLWAVWNPTTHKWEMLNVSAVAVFPTRGDAAAHINRDAALANMRCRPIRMEVGL